MTKTEPRSAGSGGGREKTQPTATELLAQHRLKLGDTYPYDAPDAWWQDDKRGSLAPVDDAHRAARAILADLTDRRGIKHGFEGIDEDVRAELVQSLADIIRAATTLSAREDQGATIPFNADTVDWIVNRLTADGWMSEGDYEDRFMSVKSAMESTPRAPTAGEGRG